jgi:hypothetical protein
MIDLIGENTKDDREQDAAEYDRWKTVFLSV